MNPPPRRVRAWRERSPKARGKCRPRAMNTESPRRSRLAASTEQPPPEKRHTRSDRRRWAILERSMQSSVSTLWTFVKRFIVVYGIESAPEKKCVKFNELVQKGLFNRKFIFIFQPDGWVEPYLRSDVFYWFWYKPSLRQDQVNVTLVYSWCFYLFIFLFIFRSTSCVWNAFLN